MRVKSDLFVSALVRRAFALGGFAAIEKKGAEEAGAIFVRVLARDGRVSLYAPAPQSIAVEQEEAMTDDRLFECRLKDAEADEASAFLEREKRFDPDLWIVDLELEAIGDLLPLAAD